MTWYALRIAMILIIIHSLIFFPTPVTLAQDHPTEAEVKQAREAADLFMKLLMDVLAPTMFKLTLGEINGKQRIVWAEAFTPDC